MDKKILVAYFSASGVTEGIAKRLSEALDAEMVKITPQTPYTSKDLDWMDRKSRSSVEMADEKTRPGIKAIPDSAYAYDTIFIGFPIWWYVEPRIVDTFLDKIGTKGKKIIPFATSGGSGIEKAQRHLESLYPEANWIEGKLLGSGTVTSWADEMNKKM